MNKLKKVTLLLMLLTLGACEKNNKVIPEVNVPLEIEVKTPLGIDGDLFDIKGTITGEDGVAIELSFDKNIAKCEPLEGLYTVEISAKFRYLDDHHMFREQLLSLSDKLELKGTEKVSKVLQFTSFQSDGTFLIEEIFFSGTTTIEGSQYDNDKYIKIRNNSTQTLYADGLSLLVSHFNPDDKKNNLSPNIIPEKFPVKIAYQIKGKGTDFPVNGGETIIICQSAIDHTEFNPNSFSLIKANFEWVSDQAVIDGEFPNNPDVPNMTLLYSNDGSGVWSMNNNGNETYAIAQIPADFISNISKYSYNYEEDLIIDGVNYGTFPGEPALGVPNEYILDAVNLSPKNDWQWLPISPKLDSGFTYVVEEFNSSERYKLSVVRKSQVINGVNVLIDTNNSSEDFIISNPATLLIKK